MNIDVEYFRVDFCKRTLRFFYAQTAIEIKIQMIRFKSTGCIYKQTRFPLELQGQKKVINDLEGLTTPIASVVFIPNAQGVRCFERNYLICNIDVNSLSAGVHEAVASFEF